MSKKKKHDEGHIDESWLIPYADVLTLLLALFIVLFCSSSLDMEKYKQIMRAFAKEFNVTQTTEGGGGGDFLPDEMADLMLPSSPEADEDKNGSGSGSGTGEGTQMIRLFDSLSGYIHGNDLEEEMQVKIVGESLLITLTSDIWFSSGSAIISAAQRETAEKMSDMIANSQSEEEPLRIVITGHTDDVPMHTAQFPSNWYLSAIRAVNFMEVMLDDGRLDPRMFSARGYGEFEPIDNNDTAEARQHNRRVEVLISIDIPATEQE
ncbi:MAG: OmpA family protein [Clostridiales bacterium]|nr:OmpA family protein [Clostridiales bacterium]